MIDVFIVQPVIPHYRVPLFEALDNSSGLRVRVHASRRVPGAPPSVNDLPEWADISHRCVSFLGRRLFWQQDLRLPLEFTRGDVAVISGNPRFISSARVVSAARRQGVGILWWGHGHSPTSVRWRAEIRYQMMRFADAILLYTDAEVDALRSKTKWKIPMIGLNNSMDLTAVRSAKDQWNPGLLKAFRESHRLAEKTVLLFCGRLRSHPSAEVEVAMSALSVLLQKSQKYVLAIVGSGDEETRLKNLSVKLRVQSHVRWVGSLYGEQDLAPWFLSAKCFVYPGPIGLSLIHAFGYGLPVITHSQRNAHGPEIAALREGSNGLMFRRGDADHLAHQIRALCDDERVNSKMAENALYTVDKEFSFESMLERFSRAIRVASHCSMER